MCLDVLSSSPRLYFGSLLAHAQTPTGSLALKHPQWHTCLPLRLSVSPLRRGVPPVLCTTQGCAIRPLTIARCVSQAVAVGRWLWSRAADSTIVTWLLCLLVLTTRALCPPSGRRHQRNGSVHVPHPNHADVLWRQQAKAVPRHCPHLSATGRVFGCVETPRELPFSVPLM